MDPGAPGVDRQQVFDEPTLNQVVATYRGGLTAREVELAAIETELATWAKTPPLAATVARLGAYRGIAALTGMPLAAEVWTGGVLPLHGRSWVFPG